MSLPKFNEPAQVIEVVIRGNDHRNVASTDSKLMLQDLVLPLDSRHSEQARQMQHETYGLDKIKIKIYYFTDTSLVRLNTG